MTEITILAVMPEGGYSFTCRRCNRATIVSMPNEDDPGLLIHTFIDSTVVYTPWGQLIHDCGSHTMWRCTKCRYLVSTADESLIEGHTSSRKGVYVPIAICPKCAFPMKVARSDHVTPPA